MELEENPQTLISIIVGTHCLLSMQGFADTVGITSLQGGVADRGLLLIRRAGPVIQYLPKEPV